MMFQMCSCKVFLSSAKCCFFPELTQMHKCVTIGMRRHGYPSVTLDAAPQVIPKGKWSWIMFGSLILFNTPTPGEGTVAILMLFFLCLTEWLNPPHLLSRQVPGWMRHHRHGDWGDETHKHKLTHTQSQTWKWDWLSWASGCTVWLDEKLPL